MTGFEIRERINQLYEEINLISNPAQFTLQKKVGELLQQIESYQKKCKHSYINEEGYCIYCDKHLGEEK